MPRLARWLLRLAILGLPLCAQQQAVAATDDAIVLKVRGKSQLRLRDVSRRPDGKSTFRVTLQLQLSDGVATDASGSDDRAFVDRLVAVQLRSSDDTLYLADKRTGDDGLVTFERDGVPPAAYTVTATFRGDELRDSALGVFAIDVGRQATQLRLQAPARIALSDELPLRLTLTSEGQPMEGEVELGLGRRRERLTLRQGYGELRLPAKLLGKSGDKLGLLAQFAGTRLYAPTEVRQELLLVSQATVTLQALGVGPEVAQGSRLTVIGLVRNEEGPLAGELIELEALSDETSQPSEPSGKRSLGHALTDNLGRFEITAPKLLLPTGAALLSAQVFPRRGHILPGRSPELALLVLPPEPISVLYFLLPLGVTGALWLGYVLGQAAGAVAAGAVAGLEGAPSEAGRADGQRERLTVVDLVALVAGAAPGRAGGATDAAAAAVNPAPGGRKRDRWSGQRLSVWGAGGGDDLGGGGRQRAATAHAQHRSKRSICHPEPGCRTLSAAHRRAGLPIAAVLCDAAASGGIPSGGDSTGAAAGAPIG
jgi:hypothetical protein